MAVPIGIIGNTFNQVWTARDYSLLLSKTRKKLHQWGYTADDIPTLFKAVHYADCAVLELDDFIELVKDMKIGLSEDRIIALFENMDKECSGALDAAEFAQQLFPGARIGGFGYAGNQGVRHPTDESGSPKLTRTSLRALSSENLHQQDASALIGKTFQRQDSLELTASQPLSLTAGRPSGGPA